MMKIINEDIRMKVEQIEHWLNCVEKLYQASNPNIDLLKQIKKQLSPSFLPAEKIRCNIQTLLEKIVENDSRASRENELISYAPNLSPGEMFEALNIYKKSGKIFENDLHNRVQRKAVETIVRVNTERYKPFQTKVGLFDRSSLPAYHYAFQLENASIFKINVILFVLLASQINYKPTTLQKKVLEAIYVSHRKEALDYFREEIRAYIENFSKPIDKKNLIEELNREVIKKLEKSPSDLNAWEVLEKIEDVLKTLPCSKNK